MGFVFHFLLLGLLSWVIAGLWLNEKLLPLRTRDTSADALNTWLQSWQLLSSTGGALSTLGDVPRFKFFSRLAEAGLRHARSFGSFPRELLWEWREGLAREKSFDQRWRSLTHTALAQFALFTVITWCFVFACGELLTPQRSLAPTLVMGALQLSGAVLFFPCMKGLAAKKLAGLSELMEALYVLRALSGAGLPTTQVLQEARLEQLPAAARQCVVYRRVMELATLYQKQGGALGREAHMLLQEVWFLRDETLAKLVKTGEALKLVFLLVFYAGAYFLFLASLVWELLRAS